MGVTLSLILLAATASGESDWRAVGKTYDSGVETSYFLDANSISRGPERITFWFTEVQSRPIYGVDRTLSWLSTDCTQDPTILYRAFYLDTAKVSEEESDGKTDALSYVAEDEHPFAKLVKIVCGQLPIEGPSIKDPYEYSRLAQVGPRAPFATGWRFAGAGEGSVLGSAQFIDAGSIRSESGKVQFWAARVYGRATEVGADYTLMYIDADCADYSHTVQYGVELNGSTHISSWSSDMTASAPRGTLIHILIAQACRDEPLDKAIIADPYLYGKYRISLRQ